MRFCSVPPVMNTHIPQYDPFPRREFAPDSGNYYATPLARPAILTGSSVEHPSLIEPLVHDIAPSAPTTSSASLQQSYGAGNTSGPCSQAEQGHGTVSQNQTPSGRYRADSGFCSPSGMRTGMVDDTEGSLHTDQKPLTAAVEEAIVSEICRHMTTQEAADKSMAQTNGLSGGPRIETPRTPRVEELRGNGSDRSPRHSTPSPFHDGRPVPQNVVPSVGPGRQREARLNGFMVAPQQPDMQTPMTPSPVYHSSPSATPHPSSPSASNSANTGNYGPAQLFAQQGHGRQMIHPAHHPRYSNGSGSSLSNVSSPVSQAASPQNVQPKPEIPPSSPEAALVNAFDIEQFNRWKTLQKQYPGETCGTSSHEDEIRRFRQSQLYSMRASMPSPESNASSRRSSFGGQGVLGRLDRDCTPTPSRPRSTGARVSLGKRSRGDERPPTTAPEVSMRKILKQEPSRHLEAPKRPHAETDTDLETFHQGLYQKLTTPPPMAAPRSRPTIAVAQRHTPKDVSRPAAAVAHPDPAQFKASIETPNAEHQLNPPRYISPADFMAPPTEYIDPAPITHGYLATQPPVENIDPVDPEKVKSHPFNSALPGSVSDGVPIFDLVDWEFEFTVNDGMQWTLRDYDEGYRVKGDWEKFVNWSGGAAVEGA